MAGQNIRHAASPKEGAKGTHLKCPYQNKNGIRERVKFLPRKTAYFTTRKRLQGYEPFCE